jgi:hypothetical protein
MPAPGLPASLTVPIPGPPVPAPLSLLPPFLVPVAQWILRFFTQGGTFPSPSAGRAVRASLGRPSRPSLPPAARSPRGFPRQSALGAVLARMPPEPALLPLPGGGPHLAPAMELLLAERLLLPPIFVGARKSNHRARCPLPLPLVTSHPQVARHQPPLARLPRAASPTVIPCDANDYSLRPLLRHSGR